jgi:hypothetical protein
MKKQIHDEVVVDIEFGQEDCDDPIVYQRVEEERQVQGENPFKGQRGEAAWRAYELACHHGVDAAPPDPDFAEEMILVHRQLGPKKVARGGFHKFNAKLDWEQRAPMRTTGALRLMLSGLWQRNRLLSGTGFPASGE